MKRKSFGLHYRVGNMETYSNGSQIMQGQPVYQLVGKSSGIPQVQQSVQNNASLPNIVPSGYQYTQPNSTVHFSGLNAPNYVVQGVDNSNKVLFLIRNPVCRYNTLNLSVMQGNNQRDQLQNLQLTGQVVNNASVSTGTTEKIFKNPNLANAPVKDPLKIPEPTHVNLGTHTSEKVGSLKIQVCESFLPWKVTNKTVLDLEFMRHIFNISGVDIRLTDPKLNEKALGTAVKQLLLSKILSDWLVLKCEEKEIPFLKVNNQVEVYTASNFSALLNVVSNETCLPLPFITEENNRVKYLYLNFPKTGSDKIKKLNTPIFHVPDSGKKRLPCKYPGIRMDCDFENAADSFIIHVHQSALLVYETSLSEIRQFIIYRHIIWGFLQTWIREVKEQYNQCFKFEDIAKNLSLCKADGSEDDKSHGNDKGLIYDIGFLNCYLKFDPVSLKETRASFSLENFSTNFVCNLSIVQYYKQYFLINDMHFSDALKNTVLFFRNCYDKNLVKGSNYVVLPQTSRLVFTPQKKKFIPQEQLGTFLNNTQTNMTDVDLSASTGGLSAPGTIATGINKYMTNANLSATTGGISASRNVATGFYKQMTNADLLASTSGIAASRTIEAGISKTKTNVNLSSSTSGIAASRTIAVETGKNDVRVESGQTATKTVLTKPLLKARTVEEINSSVDRMKITGSNKHNTVKSDVRQVKNFKRKGNTHQLNYTSFISLIQKFMKNCYATNKVELCSRDESKEKDVIEQRFNEAVKRAVAMETVESFIEKIYIYLQLYYTNSTCQNILNQNIWRAIEAKYPHLKECYSESIAESLKNKSGIGPLNNKSLLNSESESEINVSPTSDGEDYVDITSLPVTLQPETSTPFTEVSTFPRENDKAVIAVPEETDINTRRTSEPGVSLERINKEKSHGNSTNEQPKERNACNSASNTCHNPLKKHKKHKKKRSEKYECGAIPYRNTLTFVRVSDSPVTFRISASKSTESERSGIQKNESCTAPKELPTETSNEMLETDRTLEGEQSLQSLEKEEGEQSLQSLEKEEGEQSLQSREKEEGEQSLQSREKEEGEQSLQSLEKEEGEQSLQSVEKEQEEQSLQSVEKEQEVVKESPQEKDYLEYNLKPCSVVLNSNDVEMYLKTCRKRKRVETSHEESESEGDYVPGRIRRRLCSEDLGDYEFLAEGKRLRKKVSDMQYMEARTRVLQRLRKRKSLYVGYERTRIVGEELDKFCVRRSLSSKASCDENREENEDVDEVGKRYFEVNRTHTHICRTQMEKEAVNKELRVVLVRLEDTSDYEKYRDNLLRQQNWNPAVDYLNKENFPRMKNKYFEVREGKLYLKEEYHVKNGVIVRTDNKVDTVKAKTEPESPTRETDADPVFIKSESTLD